MSACLRSIYSSTVDTMARHIVRFVGHEECMTCHSASLCVLRIKCVIAKSLVILIRLSMLHIELKRISYAYLQTLALTLAHPPLCPTGCSYAEPYLLSHFLTQCCVFSLDALLEAPCHEYGSFR